MSVRHLAATAVRRTTFAAVALAVIAASLPAAASADEAPTRLLVTYADPVGAEVVAADMGQVRAASVLSAPLDAGRAATDGGGPSEERSRVQVLELPDRASAAAVERRLRANDRVVAVEADVRVSIHAGGEAWGIANHGQVVQGTTGTRAIDIGARQAWPNATGRGAVVAVLDTGVDLDHPLLHGRLWRNPGESVSGRDDDGNGYVDDVHGWNFANDTPDVAVSTPADVHATHLAGIIVGRPHDATGFRGVAGGARVMVARFIDDQGNGWTSDAVRALRYAVDNGADVVNMSFGSEQDSVALRTAMVESGLPIVTASGNTGQTHEHTPIYPGSYGLANQVSVAAVDNTGAMAPFSATSRRTVHVAAPGHRIVSTIPGSRLGMLSGTSMAAPFVAGVVALAVQAAPDATAEELVAAVKRGARPLPGAAETSSGGIARGSGTLPVLGSRLPVCRSSGDIAFQDVGPEHTHRRGVACLVANELTAGVSADRYGAELGLTRGQVASLVAASLDRAGILPEVPTTGRFSDVDGSVHRDAIERLASIGVVRGVTSTIYDPSGAVARDGFAGIVARAAQYAAGAPTRFTGASFDDIADSPEREGVETASALSLVMGRSPGVFDPSTPVRRDQAATMLVNLLDRLHQQGMLEAA